jgi:uncharacterized membrane protein
MVTTMTLKTKLALIGVGVLILIIAGLLIYGMTTRAKVKALETEAIKQGYGQNKIHIEKEYIPAALGKLTTNEKSHMGSVMWGE